jgi:hypothetical protein
LGLGSRSGVGGWIHQMKEPVRTPVRVGRRYRRVRGGNHGLWRRRAAPSTRR